MAKRPRSAPPNNYVSFSDIALLMLSTFVFLLVTIIITSKLSEQTQLPLLQKNVSELQQALDKALEKNQHLRNNMDAIVGMTAESAMEQALASAGFAKTEAKRKDFDLFVKGLKELPGESIHLMLDATGSMHGVTTFMIPVLRVIVIRSGKRLDAVSWFSDGKTETYRGSMGSMFDNLMNGAPFVGSDETIGRAFRYAAEAAPKPGVYLLIGDEPSSDRIHYFDIPSPVFTIPLGLSNPDTNWAYQKLADETGGKMLKIELH